MLIDFHNHYAGRAARPEAAARWPALGDRGALEASLEWATRVVSTPLEFMDGPVQCANDAMAELSGERIIGLATVDVYSGEAGALELARAVKQLGLRGAFVESASGDLLPDCAEAQPTFAAAAELGVPVFLHPVPDRQLRARFGNERFIRSTINSAAILAMMASGMFDRHRGLKVVVTSLALGGLLLADQIPEGVYIDTTGMKPAVLRGSIDLLGVGRVVAGSDWPVVQEKSLLDRLDLDAESRRRVARDNAVELLRI